MRSSVACGMIVSYVRCVNASPCEALVRNARPALRPGPRPVLQSRRVGEQHLHGHGVHRSPRIVHSPKFGDVLGDARIEREAAALLRHDGSGACEKSSTTPSAKYNALCAMKRQLPDDEPRVKSYSIRLTQIGRATARIAKAARTAPRTTTSESEAVIGRVS